ncbi:16783_t:CDS:2, partial [Rhizophagus irregularis]
MISKLIAYLLLYCIVMKSSLPPTPLPNLSKIKTTFSEKVLLSLPYPFVIIEWSFYDIVFYIITILGCSLRLWSFYTLREYFTFNVTILKNHKLVDTGPYALLIHPSYTAIMLMTPIVLYVTYQLHYYIPIYSPVDFSFFVYSWYTYAAWAFIYLYLGRHRVLGEEKVLKQRFGKEWDLYSKQRK